MEEGKEGTNNRSYYTNLTFYAEEEKIHDSESLIKT